MPPGWVPRSFMQDPRDFGRPRSQPVWLRDAGSTAHLAAAYLQHRLAQGAVAELESGGNDHTLESLAAHVGESVDYVRSKLYGHAPISLKDLMAWAELLGVHIIPILDAPANFDDLLP
jgi:hypothetical protein